jgi:hypothetical protein
MTTPGQEPRGTAALRQAIATGAPVPTNGKQAAELNTFTPGEWIAQGSRITVRGSEHLTIARVGVASDGDFSVANANLIAAAPSLHAYAKAEELYRQWTEVASNGEYTPEDGIAYGKYESQLERMGWDRIVSSGEFIAGYRAAALAKAAGAK